MGFKEFVEMEEDAPTNSVGAGAIASYEKPLKVRRQVKEHDTFAGNAVFNVDADTLWKSRHGKNRYHRYSKYVGTNDVGEDIREFAKNNPYRGIILRNGNTGEMVTLRRRK